MQSKGGKTVDVLKVDDLRKSFRSNLSMRSREVLHGATFRAREGEILGFLGPNGAGKTTTIKIILGLIRPDSGSVTVFDHPIEDRTVMSRIGYLPENPYFYPHLSLHEFLTFCGQMSGMGGERLRIRIEDVIELVGLSAHGDVRLKSFSKGMLQRAGLAQAVLHDPDLLILDEPFSGLDPLGRKMVRDLLFELKRRKRTIFFSSHILPDMEALCNRTCIIREGVIVRCVGLDELIRIGEGRVEVTVRGCSPDYIEAVTDFIVAKSVTGEETFLLVKEQRYVRTVIQHLYNSGAEVLRVVNQHPSLEGIFLDEVSRGAGTREDREREEELTFVGF